MLFPATQHKWATGWRMLFQAPYRMTWGNATCYVFEHLVGPELSWELPKFNGAMEGFIAGKIMKTIGQLFPNTPLVGGLEHDFYFPYTGNFIIPID